MRISYHRPCTMTLRSKMHYSARTCDDKYFLNGLPKCLDQDVCLAMITQVVNNGKTLGWMLHTAISKWNCCRHLWTHTNRSLHPWPESGFCLHCAVHSVHFIIQTWHSSMQIMGRVPGGERGKSRRTSFTCKYIAVNVSAEVEGGGYSCWVLGVAMMVWQCKAIFPGPIYESYEHTSLEARNSTEQITSCGCLCISVLNSSVPNCSREEFKFIFQWVTLLDVRVQRKVENLKFRGNLTPHHRSNAQPLALLLNFISNRSQWHNQYSCGAWSAVG